MKKIIFVLGIVMSMAFSFCSKNKYTSTDNNPKNSPAEDPGIEPIVVTRSGRVYDTCDYMSQAETITNKMTKNLGLTSDQEKLIRRINEERASRLHEALLKRGLSETAWMNEVYNINELASQEYNKVLSEKQYDRFISIRGNYSEFKSICENPLIEAAIDTTMKIEAGNHNFNK